MLYKRKTTVFTLASLLLFDKRQVIIHFINALQTEKILKQLNHKTLNRHGNFEQIWVFALSVKINNEKNNRTISFSGIK